MPRINRVTGVTFTGVTMGSVLSVDVDYSGNYNTSQGGGSLSIAAALRSVGGTVTVVYQTAGNPAALDLAPGNLVITCKDDQDPSNGTITITLAGMKPMGNSISLSDSSFGTFAQRFQLAPGSNISAADMAPVVS